MLKTLGRKGSGWFTKLSWQYSTGCSGGRDTGDLGLTQHLGVLVLVVVIIIHKKRRSRFRVSDLLKVSSGRLRSEFYTSVR